MRPHISRKKKDFYRPLNSFHFLKVVWQFCFSNIVSWEWIFIVHVYLSLYYNLNNSIPYLCFIWYLLFEDESSVLWNQCFINDNVFKYEYFWYFLCSLSKSIFLNRLSQIIDILSAEYKLLNSNSNLFCDTIIENYTIGFLT